MATSQVFVTGATGTVGGALARQLRAINLGVKTTTRNPDSAEAKALQAIGVEVIGGDWDDEHALNEAILGCQMIFINLYPVFNDASKELQQAQNIIRIARAARVKRVVYSSIFPVQDHANPDGPLAQVRKYKQRIEEEVSNAGFESWMILRPGFFMANFLRGKVLMYPGATETGVFTSAYRADTRLPLIDPEDIAKFAIAAFQKPGAFNGKTIELAGEVLSFDESLHLLSNVAGRSLRGNYLSDEEIAKQMATNPFLGSQIAARNMADLVNMDQVQSWGVPMGTFADFLQRERVAVRETYRNVKE
ncbi:hypothetical protein B0T10DRAFT_575564 [Thelonectria olida]|uniref:NmrA-like domain-containing protein n=1 Tax=Thelonectria olida TaxID=1576542 RepID=A0A9P8W0T4_9HYPO|nr:hypothetical protein B0T10DRAFT_575564 [Thelonectria olida]